MKIFENRPKSVETSAAMHFSLASTEEEEEEEEEEEDTVMRSEARTREIENEIEDGFGLGPATMHDEGGAVRATSHEFESRAK